MPRSENGTGSRDTNFVGRDVAITCNSSGSALWASVKNIKHVVDANTHKEAIEFAHHQSPIRFSPICYRNPGSKSSTLSGQTILFGCPLELCTVGELKKIPPVLEYLLDAVHDWPVQLSTYRVSQKHTNYTANSLHCKPGEHWQLVDEIEQAWTGVEESDRALISNLVEDNLRSLILVCLLRYTTTEAKTLAGVPLGPSKASIVRR